MARRTRELLRRVVVTGALRDQCADSGQHHEEAHDHVDHRAEHGSLGQVLVALVGRALSLVPTLPGRSGTGVGATTYQRQAVAQEQGSPEGGKQLNQEVVVEVHGGNAT